MYNFDRNEIANFLTFVAWNSAPRELRVLRSDGKPIIGIFDDAQKMASAAAGIAKQFDPSGIYFGLNHVWHGDVPLICSMNKVIKGPMRTVSNANITHPGLTPVDIDPVRPSGVCSTEAEKAEAWKVAVSVRAYLMTVRGYPEPIVVDSGNGYHLYWRSSGLGDGQQWRAILKWLAMTFDSEDAKVDTAVWDHARVMRLPGTMNRKGKNTPERPHRMARVVSYPETWVEAPKTYYFAMDCGWVSQYDLIAERERRRENGEIPELLLDEEGLGKLIEEFPDHLDYYRVSHKDDRAYFYLASCPFNGGAHRDQHQGKTAIILGPESVGFKCFSSDCEEHSFRDLLDLLKRETGRKPSMPIYSTVTQDLRPSIRKWGGIEDVNRLDRIEAKKAAKKATRKAVKKAARKAAKKAAVELSEQSERAMDRIAAQAEAEGLAALEADPDFRWDRDTWAVINSGELETMGLSTDPTDWGLEFNDRAFLRTLGEVREQGVDWLTAIAAADMKALGNLLGIDRIYYIYRDKTRPTISWLVEVEEGVEELHYEENPLHTGDMERLNSGLEIEPLPPKPHNRWGEYDKLFPS